MICTNCGTDECVRWCEPCGLNYCEYDNVHEDCETDDDPPDATNPYAKPYDEALAGHLRLRYELYRATEATNAFGITLRDINAH